jgi:hypothetical protein
MLYDSIPTKKLSERDYDVEVSIRSIMDEWDIRSAVDCAQGVSVHGWVTFTAPDD